MAEDSNVAKGGEGKVKVACQACCAYGPPPPPYSPPVQIHFHHTILHVKTLFMSLVPLPLMLRYAVLELGSPLA